MAAGLGSLADEFGPILRGGSLQYNLAEYKSVSRRLARPAQSRSIRQTEPHLDVHLTQRLGAYLRARNQRYVRSQLGDLPA